MPIPIVNSIASWFLKKRIHQMELFMKYPNEVQEELLFKLIQKAKGTELGKTYDFGSITTDNLLIAYPWGITKPNHRI